MGFTTPDGQFVTVEMPEGVAAGSTVVVQYQPVGPQPLAASEQQAPLPPPQPAAAAVAGPVYAAAPQPGNTLSGASPALPNTSVLSEEDERSAKRNWVIYGLSWALCCLCMGHAWFIVPVIWLVLTCTYYCKPPAVRAQMPRQRGPALASFISCGVVLALCACGLIGVVVVAALGGGCPMHLVHRHGPHPLPHGPHLQPSGRLPQFGTRKKLLHKAALGRGAGSEPVPVVNTFDDKLAVPVAPLADAAAADVTADALAGASAPVDADTPSETSEEPLAAEVAASAEPRADVQAPADADNSADEPLAYSASSVAKVVGSPEPPADEAAKPTDADKTMDELLAHEAVASSEPLADEGAASAGVAETATVHTLHVEQEAASAAPLAQPVASAEVSVATSVAMVI